MRIISESDTALRTAEQQLAALRSSSVVEAARLKLVSETDRKEARLQSKTLDEQLEHAHIDAEKTATRVESDLQSQISALTVKLNEVGKMLEQSKEKTHSMQEDVAMSNHESTIKSQQKEKHIKGLQQDIRKLKEMLQEQRSEFYSKLHKFSKSASTTADNLQKRQLQNLKIENTNLKRKLERCNLQVNEAKQRAQPYTMLEESSNSPVKPPKKKAKAKKAASKKPDLFAFDDF